jgi:hypothetical protein
VFAARWVRVEPPSPQSSKTSNSGPWVKITPVYLTGFTVALKTSLESSDTSWVTSKVMAGALKVQSK